MNLGGSEDGGASILEGIRKLGGRGWSGGYLQSRTKFDPKGGSKVFDGEKTLPTGSSDVPTRLSV